MNIRLATLQELDTIVAIYNQSIAAGQQTADIAPVTVADRRPWFELHTPDRHPILVADTGATIAGYLTLSAYRPGRDALRHTAEVSFFVDSNHRRKGIATRLLRDALDRCPSLSIKTLFAILIDSNLDSIRFLENSGFRQWGHLPRVAEFDGIEVGHLYYGLRIDDC